MESTYTVYRHVSPNGKSYIGITKQPLDERWRHGEGYKEQKKFYKAIKKYGWDNFEHHVLNTGLTFEDAAQTEREYIQLFNSFNNGYNATLGGEGTSGDGVRPVCQYTLEGAFVCRYDSGKEASRQTGIGGCSISAACTQRHRSAGGYIWRFEDDPVVIPEMHVIEQKGIRTFKSRGQRRTVMQFSTDGKLLATYNSLYNASEVTGINHKRIAECCTKKGNLTAGGYRWMYEDSPRPFADTTTYPKPVKCLDTGETFPSVKAAARAFGIDDRYISSNCLHHRKSTNGYHFAFLEEINEQEKLHI